MYWCTGVLGKVYIQIVTRVKVEPVELKYKYPVLADHVSASEVSTDRGSELLVYNTVTGMKWCPNQAVFSFLTLATGKRSFEEIVKELSEKSGEPPEQIWPGLSELAAQMVEDGILFIGDSPALISRGLPPSVELVRRLESVNFETTRACNLHCRHCYADAGTFLQDELTVKEIKALIDELADLGVLSITFTGGEPLLHPFIGELMEYARKKPLTVILFTNGTLLTPEIVEKLKGLQVYRVITSIDGPDPETHDTLRGVRGAFEKTIQGVNLLKEAGIDVFINVSITRFNYKKIKDILHLITDLKVKGYRLWPVTFSGRGSEQDIFLTTEEFRAVMEAVREFEFEVLGKQKEEVYYTKKVRNCGIGSNSLTIKCNGVVTPCAIFDEDVSLGNVRTHSVKEMWNSRLLNRLRAITVFETDMCKDCRVAAVCKGGCIANNYRRSGEFRCYDEYMCVAFDVTKDDFVPVEVEDISSDSLSVEIV